MLTDTISGVQFHIVTRCSPPSELSASQNTSYQLFTDKQMSVVSE